MMLKQCLILFLLPVGPLSAETAVVTKEPVKKTLSHRQEVVLLSVVCASNAAMGWFFPKTIFSKSNSLTDKAMLLGIFLGISVVLTKIEKKFFERYPYLLGPCEESETKQENVPC